MWVKTRARAVGMVPSRMVLPATFFVTSKVARPR
jgi:hypothetical protein